ncbi:signal recognition particle-docking protein FtsY [Mycoplasma buteonis]|uniref:signal recognition particle-docking protein FtsY n=1 Tax=Mycoplasma buteonis TaxID=171280 RepID=UPI000562F8DA|nr:signal recognition particle-docking protein FtsY [Mycoplasma buteonis]
MNFFKKLINKITNKSNQNEITLNNSENFDEFYQQKIEKYQTGLSNASNFGKKLLELQNSHTKIDENYFEDLEELLIMSDINYKLVNIIIDKIKSEIRTNQITDIKLINEIIADQLFIIYANNSVINTTLNFDDSRKTNVFIFVGVNGSGKTTSIAKVAYKYIKQGKKVLIAAADTFRAGAVNQLQVWSDRIGAKIVKPDKEGQDPASVVYKAMQKAVDENYDLVIIDTAGRLQNKINLMNELEKMIHIIQKFEASAPHESLLVLDSTTGQNGLSQAKIFKEVANLTGIVLTKLDGTSKGGIVLSIKDEYDLDVKLVGLGEKLNDLQEFDLDLFIYQMMKDIIHE